MTVQQLITKIDNLDSNKDLEKFDTINIVADGNYPSGYRVDIAWKVGTEGDGTDVEDLDDILYHDLDNPDVMAVLREYFEER